MATGMDDTSERGRQRRRGRARQEGQATIWIIFMLLFLLLAGGLAIDGGRYLAEYIRVHNLADAAAHSAAQQIDPVLFRESAGATVVLDQRRVEETVGSFCAAEPGRHCTLDASATQVTIQVDEELQTTLLQHLGLRSLPVRATGHAEVDYTTTQ